MVIKKTAKIKNKILEISFGLKVTNMIENNITNLCKMPFSSFSEDLDAVCESNPEIMDEILKTYAKTISLSEEQRVFLKFQKEICQNSQVIDEKVFESNSYYQTVHCKKDIVSGKFKLSTRTIPKYTILSIDEEKTLLSSDISIPCLGIFKDDIQFLSLMEGDNVWMSITPMEINTMKKAIQEANGNILTFGCGLGYFAFMTSEKETVSDVTIVEQSQDVIDLFEQHILPQFPHKEKIHIVKADAFEYVEELSDCVFDYCFVDIWKSVSDIQTYMKMKNICKKFHTMKVSYWIENELLQGVSRYVKLILINEYYEKNVIENYKKQPAFVKKNPFLEDFIYFTNRLKKAKINTASDIDYYLKPENWI